MPDHKAYFAAQQEQYLAILDKLVRSESPSRDKAAIDRLGSQLAAHLAGMPGSLTRLPQTEAGDIYQFRFPGRSGGSQFLILCHMDTVWPLGTLAERPPRVEGDRYVAPGAADMKGGIVIALGALSGLHSLGLQPASDVLLLLTSDEEIGSRASRSLIEEQARQSQLVLCLEPGMPDGSLKTARKGGMTVKIKTTGRAAHAGADHAAGVNAIEEMAHQVISLQALTNYELGTTVSVGKIEGGVTTNIVPPACTAFVDVRIALPAERERMDRVLRAMRPRMPGAGLEVEISPGRPPMPRNEIMAAAYQKARQIGERCGLQLTEASTGGASDANFAAALGVPVLDGLGVVGGGLHAVDEYIEITSLTERACLLAALLTEWQVS
jgi:glutamate carboxypeptidase